MKNIRYLFEIAFTFILLTSLQASGQEKNVMLAPNSIYKVVAHLDSVLFSAFNNRNLDTLKVRFSKDLEFFHDEGGLTDYKHNIQAFDNSFKKERKVRRELVPGTLEVSPIKGYGALETGVHRFYATEKGEKEKLSSEAKFAMIWRQVNGTWKVTRVISYSHQEYIR